MADLSFVEAGRALTPYCGAPPTPATLAARWNLDPVLIACLLLLAGAYLVRTRRSLPLWRRGMFMAGWLLASLALVSPLCALSVALFSARVGQHMVLTTLAAPLVALGWPDRVVGRRAGAPVMAAGAYAAALWYWHAPSPYAATFESTLVYWTMHLTTLAAALWLWTALINEAGDRLAACAGAILLTTVQMGLLGALITFARTPLYWPHAFTTSAFGLSALEDQELGGVLMWVPAGLIFVVGLCLAFGAAMRRAEARSQPGALT